MANTKFLDYNGLSKLVEKIKNTYLNLGGGAMSGTITTVKDSKPAIDFRGAHDSYGVTINYDTAGNEALALNMRHATTSFMINSGVNGKEWTTSGKYSTVTPTLQVKGKHVSINELIPDNTTPSYALGVNGTIKATSFTGKYSYGGINRDFVYNVIDGVNHYIKCNDTIIIRANETNLSKYAFIVNGDTKGGCYIYDSEAQKGTTWGPNGIIFDKAGTGTLVAADGTFATAITDAEIQTEIDKAITL